jgi:2-polyprenyl-6-methoxyphenol hydroxylase-like FAD-dependent oxidoreductase
LAGELARARGDYQAAFAAYEQQMREPVLRSRAFASGAAKTVVPASRAALWAVTRGAQLVSALPTPVTRAIARLNTNGVRMHDSIPLPDYGAGVWQH